MRTVPISATALARPLQGNSSQVKGSGSGVGGMGGNFEDDSSRCDGEDDEDDDDYCRAPNFFSLSRGYLLPMLDFFRGYFHPPCSLTWRVSLHNRSSDLSVFKSCVWYLDFECNEHGFSQLIKCKIWSLSLSLSHTRMHVHTHTHTHTHTHICMSHYHTKLNLAKFERKEFFPF